MNIIELTERLSFKDKEGITQIVVSYDNQLNLFSLREQICRAQRLNIKGITNAPFPSRTIHELLKYVGVGSEVEFEISRSPHLASAGLKAILGAHFAGEFTLISQSKNKSTEVILFIREKNLRSFYFEPRNGWSVCLLTLGDKVDYLLKFYDNLSRTCHTPWELLIVTPRNLSHLPSSEKVKQIVFSEKDDLGWITRKKNLLCQLANYSDIVVAHDRFLFEDDFFRDMDRWGFAYGIAVPRVRYSDGRGLDWAVVKGGDWYWPRGALVNYRAWDSDIYAPGGLVLIRKSFWQHYSWDENIFWNEHEDVELSRRVCRLGEVIYMADAEVRTLTDRWVSHNYYLPYSHYIDR